MIRRQIFEIALCHFVYYLFKNLPKNIDVGIGHHPANMY